MVPIIKKNNNSNAENLFLKYDIEKIISFEEDEPFEILGPHYFSDKDLLVVNFFLPHAQQVEICFNSQKFKMKKINKGFFQYSIQGVKELNYTIIYKDESGLIKEIKDPYSFNVDFSDYDLYLSQEGTNYKSYEKFGGRLKEINGIKGVQFIVWAPNAKAVSVIGNFNNWKVGAHPLNRIKLSGVWGIFIPGLSENEIYKFAIKTKHNHILEKIDPYALYAEMRPKSASIITNMDDYQWNDKNWMEKRESENIFEKPISIYEVHLGSWKKNNDGSFFNYREIAHDLVNYVKELGYTHIELLPIMEHPLDKSWGYQTLGYYAPTSRFGSPKDFMYFVDHCHKNNIGVILDWVPSHFPKDMHGLNFFDGEQIYAYSDWKRGEHKEWGTLVFDYFRPEVKNFLISNAIFWLEKYHVDGLRVDAVASMLYLDYSRKDGEWSSNMFGGREHLEAIDFIKKFNEIIHEKFKGVLTIAEESTAWSGVSRPTFLGGLGFSMKWNMGWMHDTLKYFEKDPIYRKHHQDMLTFSLIYAFHENFILPISHDEVVYGKRSLLDKMPGDIWQKFANVRLFLGYMFCHPGKKLLFMGQDFGQWDEWNSDKSLDWNLLEYENHKKLNTYFQDLSKLYKDNKSLYEVDFDHQGFEWIDFSDSASCVIIFMRHSKDKKESLLIACNMTPVPRIGYKVGVSESSFYKEIFNSDSEHYGGSGLGNLGGVYSEESSYQGKPYSIHVNLPPLAINIFKLEKK